MGKIIMLVKLILTVFFINSTYLCFSQTATTITTPNGSVVSDTYFRAEFDTTEITAANNYVSSTYPLATRLTNGTQTYNCHAYAWHMTEGGNTVWLGLYGATAEDIYRTDDSYIEVCSQTFPAKVFYASDNHSAVTTNTTDIFKSKWGSLPLMEMLKITCLTMLRLLNII